MHYVGEGVETDSIAKAMQGEAQKSKGNAMRDVVAHREGQVDRRKAEQRRGEAWF